MITVLGCFVASSAVLAATYHVDDSNPDASDSNPGTFAQPYRTIAAAVAQRAGAGDTVQVQPGVYRESITISAGGVAGAPFVLQASGPGVTIEGADDYSSTGQWAPVSGDVYLAASVNWTPSQVFVDDVRLQVSTATPAAIPSNSYRYVLGAGLYVNAGGGNPGNRAIAVSRRNTGFFVSSKPWVTISGFELRRQNSDAVRVINASANSVISGLRITEAGHSGIMLSSCTDVTVEKCAVFYSNDHGINLIGATNSVIRGNESSDNARPVERAANGLYLSGSVGNRIERNRFHHNQDSGTNLVSDSNDNLFIQNMSWDNGDHGFDHVRATGSIHIGDVAYRNFKDGFSMEGASDRTQLHDCISIDNGLTTGRFDLWIDAASSAGFVSDYNIIWNSVSTAPPIRHGSTLYLTLPPYTAATGLDAHSIQLDPLFLDAPRGDFHLLAGSPAIDAANSAPENWPSTDFDGRPRFDDPATENTGVGRVAFADRGAFEFEPSDVPPIVVAPATVTVNEGEPLTIEVTASDAQPIASLTASLEGLPTGNNAQFIADATNTTGTLTWTPTPADAPGPYTVTFTATNALSGSASTAITVSDATSQANLVGNPSFEIGLDGWKKNGSTTPTRVAGGHTGDYSVQMKASSGTFGIADSPNWVARVPAAGTTYRCTAWVRSAGHHGEARIKIREYVGSSQIGNSVYSTPVVLSPAWQQIVLEFTATRTGSTLEFEVNDYPVASNEIFQVDDVSITIVSPGDRAPVVTAPDALSATPGARVSVTVTAADPDGDAIDALSADLSALPAGHDAQFEVSADHTTGTLTWTPGPGITPGQYPVIFAASNALTGADTTSISVLGTSDGGSNRVGNPGFESDLGGWSKVNSSAKLVRITSGGHSGTACLEVRGPSSGGFGATDEPNWIASVPAAGTPYRFSAWVRSAAHRGNARIKVREFDGDTQVGDSDYSTPLRLSTAWQQIVFDYTARKAGTTLDLEINDYQVGSYEIFQIDDVSITVVSPGDRAPVVTAPETLAAKAGVLLTMTVMAADPDGDAIDALAADLSALPDGHDARFTVSTDHTTGTLTWTPAPGTPPGPYPVFFTATNALSGADTTSISVTDTPGGPSNRVGNPGFETDLGGWSKVNSSAKLVRITSSGHSGTACLEVRGPSSGGFGATDDPNWIVSVPAAGTHYRFSAWVRSATHHGNARIKVREFDGDSQVGESVYSTPLTLTPAWRQIVFHYEARRAGTTLDLEINDYQVGSYEVFQIDDVSITIATPGDRAPVVTAPEAVQATPDAELSVTVNAADPDGDAIDVLEADLSALPVGNDARFTVNADRTVGTLTWTPAPETPPGPYPVIFMATNALSGVDTASISVIGPLNWVNNPGFETDLGGWAKVNSSAKLVRITSGGHSGTACLEVRGPSSGGFGATDEPNWIVSVPAAGTPYRFTAWVRSAAHHGNARIKVREFAGSSQVGESVYSTPLRLSATWQQIVFDYEARRANTTLDLEINDYQVGSNEIFQIDDVSITILTPAPGTATRLEASSIEARPLIFGARMNEQPVRGAAVLEVTTTQKGRLQIELFDAQGRRLQGPASRLVEAGVHHVPLEENERLRPGVCFYRVRAVDGERRGRFVIAR